jgi:hypothetical protein
MANLFRYPVPLNAFMNIASNRLLFISNAFTKMFSIKHLIRLKAFIRSVRKEQFIPFQCTYGDYQQQAFCPFEYVYEKEKAKAAIALHKGISSDALVPMCSIKQRTTLNAVANLFNMYNSDPFELRVRIWPPTET